MPQQASKIEDPETTAGAAAEAVEEIKSEAAGEETGSEDDEPTTAAGSSEPTAQKKKKRSRRKQIKEALTSTDKGKAAALPADVTSLESAAGKHLSKDQLEMLLQSNPALKNELMARTKGDPAKLLEVMKNLNINEMLTGLSAGGKNVKDMGDHRFWKTQPVPTFDELAKAQDIVDGPIKEIDIERVRKEPEEFPVQGFEWVTLDLDEEEQLEEVYELLTNHYVEDNDAMFRFRYSPSFLNWALKAPGWKKQWHVGVRASKSGGKGTLCAFISAIPIQLRVRDRVLNASEVNFLCVHKKLRSKRLTPLLIKEITRRCYVEGVFQAVYTVGSMLPTPVSTCRYFHRLINWEKLYDVGFCALPVGSTVTRQRLRYKLPDKTSIVGMRPMEPKDTDAVLDLLKRYLARMKMAQDFSKEEFEHWMFQDKNAKEQVVWSYVVEDPTTKKITDFVSFYNLESSVLGPASKKHKVIKAAYLWYYASEAAFKEDKGALKKRLNEVMHDTLILANKEKFDVFNALTLLDNPYFLEEQKFGAGDGQLHYYLYNYRAAPLGGGIDARNQASESEKHIRGIGLVML